MNRFPIFPLAELSERSIQRVPNNQRPWAFALLHAAACLAILGAVAVFSASAMQRTNFLRGCLWSLFGA
jgi:hypothetical protein